MERAAAEAPQSRDYLAPTIHAFAAQLDSGVRQYNEMVTAAAHLVSPGNLVIICAYAHFEEAEFERHRPQVVHVDTQNRQTRSH